MPTPMLPSDDRGTRWLRMKTEELLATHGFCQVVDDPSQPVT